MKENEKKTIRRAVSDLGAASYVKLHGFPVAGRKNRNFYFDVEESDLNQFEQLLFDYANSPMHDFDSMIMSLKKLPEYLPEKQ